MHVCHFIFSCNSMIDLVIGLPGNYHTFNAPLLADTPPNIWFPVDNIDHFEHPFFCKLGCKLEVYINIHF